MSEWTLDGEWPRPEFARILVVGTGALSVAFMPFWVNWLNSAAPRAEKRYALTRSARRFVSPEAVGVLGRTEVISDDWDAFSAPHVPHVELAEWPDLILVHPASMHFIGRFASGAADTPVMTALQLTRALVGVAPALPPGALDNCVVQQHLEALRARSGVVVARTIVAESASTGEKSDGASVPLNELYDLCVETRRADG